MHHAEQPANAEQQCSRVTQLSFHTRLTPLPERPRSPLCVSPHDDYTISPSVLRHGGGLNVCFKGFACYQGAPSKLLRARSHPKPRTEGRCEQRRNKRGRKGHARERGGCEGGGVHVAPRAPRRAGSPAAAARGASNNLAKQVPPARPAAEGGAQRGPAGQRFGGGWAGKPRRCCCCVVQGEAGGRLRALAGHLVRADLLLAHGLRGRGGTGVEARVKARVGCWEAGTGETALEVGNAVRKNGKQRQGGSVAQTRLKSVSIQRVCC